MAEQLFTKPATAPKAAALQSSPEPAPASAPVATPAPVVDETAALQSSPEPAPASAPVATPAPVVDETADQAPLPVMDELTVLKNRAKLMGISFSNNIGIEALRAKVKAAAEGTSQDDDSTDEDTEQPKAAAAPVAAPEKPQTIRQKLYAEQMKLVRVRITCLDPKKKDLPGEIITVGNKYIGTVRKFVPFGEFTDNGYHVPFIIYTLLKEREFLSIKTRKTPRGPIVEQAMAREFAIEVLPPLTEAELADLKASQMARGDQA